ncbi:PqqD family peptide modification chaperone [Xanthomonas cassavae CFBP 4642]|uniref:PqqD family peptide modification chaperone n=1 Tax=Xanthomonas cassavae CFBP 4642 TaxID=1219375 RepID=A0ABS8HC12_9XANT|nr:PqqD family protein [Xanthomonas cassavae]MCC4619706.1 PqqD family peptide modification chaperone [Xanthomonas cassavae CFBP 4642]
MRIAPTTLIAQAPGCLTAEMGEELVIMSTERGLYFSLDPVGKDVWMQIASPRTLGDLCDRLSAQYATARSIIEADVIALLETLHGAGAVEIRA